MKRRLIEHGALLLALSGCTSGNLFFTTYTKVGLDMTVTNGVPTQAMLGFKRFEGAIVPVEVVAEEDREDGEPEQGAGAGGDTETDSAEEPEAMSVFAAVELKNSWLKGLKIRQVFATGPAAESAAANGPALTRILEAGRDGPGGGDETTQEDG